MRWTWFRIILSQPLVEAVADEDADEVAGQAEQFEDQEEFDDQHDDDEDYDEDDDENDDGGDEGNLNIAAATAVGRSQSEEGRRWETGLSHLYYCYI